MNELLGTNPEGDYTRVSISYFPSAGMLNFCGTSVAAALSAFS